MPGSEIKHFMFHYSELGYRYENSEISFEAACEIFEKYLDSGEEDRYRVLCEYGIFISDFGESENPSDRAMEIFRQAIETFDSSHIKWVRDGFPEDDIFHCLAVEFQKRNQLSDSLILHLFSLVFRGNNSLEGILLVRRLTKMLFSEERFFDTLGEKLVLVLDQVDQEVHRRYKDGEPTGVETERDQS